MRRGKHLGHFLNLPRRLVRSEVNRRPHRHRAHVERLLDAPEHDLIELVRISQKFVVIQFHQEGNPVRIFARARSQDAQRRRHRVAAAFDGQLDDILRIEVQGIGREARPGRVLDPLIHRENRNISRPRQPPVVDNLIEIAQNVRTPIRLSNNSIHKIRPRKMK